MSIDLETSTPQPEDEQAIERIVAMLDAVDSRADATALRERSYELLDLSPGDTAVDVGCGTGRATGELAARGVTAVGIDLDDRMIRVARRRWADVDFRVAAAQRLPFADASVDGYRADKVLHDLDDPAEAVREAWRVLVPGGRIVLMGQDWDLWVVDAADRELTARIMRARAGAVSSPDSARSSRRLLLDYGFRDVAVEGHVGVFTESPFLPVVTGAADTALTAAAITAAEADAWLRDLHRRAETGRLLAAVPFFVTSAVKSR